MNWIFSVQKNDEYVDNIIQAYKTVHGAEKAGETSSLFSIILELGSPIKLICNSQDGPKGIYLLSWIIML